MASSPSSRRSRPTSAGSVDDNPSSTSSIQIQRSSSADPNRVSKRKGTRSVSTLTPAQLARKRANDREAQRAIRARTKEHIERLEAELDELRSERQRDQTVQELLLRNKMLEQELKSLRESMGISFHSSSPYSTPGALDSPRTSPYPAGDFATTTAAAATTTTTSAPPMPGYTSAYVPFANPSDCESWAAAVSASAGSNVSSPVSSAADDYAPGPSYLPTSALGPMVQSPAANAMRGPHDGVKMEYDDGNDHGFPPENLAGGGHSSSAPPSNMGTPPMSSMSQPFLMPPQHQQQHQQQQQHQNPGAWAANNGIYYAPMPHPVY
ncbi:hypothetical protein ACRE_089600 [Hapsidospora chrysogenum ATCC 11550]|uniref:BZIP domain-containing protein n=1 Tax=Hapsidospora chrysogenum (strain ATCC 11550 / CBS 779.69 / DSM 880 / IAM 14645 / JCM 23072 / IMI 49137) TaxID=857340 RepID=A0A086STE6_HAPC1|nr:hypothetical protein ACRE_089600 [Hapsidospora chrysogenum ATCC 11550]